MLLDLTIMTEDELRDLIRNAQTELDRKRTLKRAPLELAQLATSYLRARGLKPGDPWQPQPVGAIDAFYPAGWTVQHEGALWMALPPGTITEPGGSGWQLVEGLPQAPEPYDPATTYSTGQRVAFEGQVWRSLTDDNTGSPAENPPGWDVVTA
ncbi:hypothetical protein V2J56_09235 [Georgenia sp. MJ206]|uniref:hypothetical protein n=1 Tax=Georgenia wangjunii TaxID=3117730 RepID=UPI002F269F2A